MIFGPALFANTRIVGQQVFASDDGLDTKVFNWTVPGGVFEISAVAVGAGGNRGLFLNDPNRGVSSGGGALSYSNGVGVTPGEVLEILIQSGGDFGEQSPARYSGIRRDGQWILRAQVGGSGLFDDDNRENNYGGMGGQAVNGIGDVRHSGGAGRGSTNTGVSSGHGHGGGGAAGYGGKGGDGAAGASGMDEPTATGEDGLGGGGGGGGSADFGRNSNGGAGGGVGLNGQGSNGAGGIYRQVSDRHGGGGGGGSGGQNGDNGATFGFRFGGNYGGGAAYQNEEAGIGGAGAVRIIWGEDRSYPFNAGSL